MVVNPKSTMGRLERSWAVVCCATLLLMACLNLLNIPMYGMGLIRRGGDFVLIKGPFTRTIDQTLGFQIYVLQWALVALGITTALLTVGVLMRHKKLDLSVILPGESNKIFRYLLILSFVLLAITALALHGVQR